MTLAEPGDRAQLKAVPLVSVVMPCLDEADAVGECVQTAADALRRMGVAGEVVVADNGSTDGSDSIATEAGARVVREGVRGYGAAYLKGFQEARGRYLVMGDADGSYPFSDIERFVDPLQSGDFDMVIGNRLGGDILPGAMPWTHRWIGNPVLSGMLRLFFGTRIADSHCGMRSFTREAYDRMSPRTTGMEFASELVVNALRANLRIKEIPITYSPRIGESKLSGFRDAWRHVRFMLLFSPSYLFQLPGIFLLLTGAFLMAALAGGPRAAFGRTWDYHPFLFGAVAVMAGYNLILFDVIAKLFSIGAGLARPRPWMRHAMRLFSLERGVLLGLSLILIGVGFELSVAVAWIRSGYGPLTAMREVVFGLVSIAIGLQTVFASFLISLLSLNFVAPSSTGDT